MRALGCEGSWMERRARWPRVSHSCGRVVRVLLCTIAGTGGTIWIMGIDKELHAGYCVLGAWFWMLLVAFGSGFSHTEKTRYKNDRARIALVTTWSGENEDETKMNVMVQECPKT